MDSYIQNYGQFNTIIYVNVIDNAKWNMIYDGNGLDLEAKHNNEAIYMKLNNEELMKLLEIPANTRTIHERLKADLHLQNKDDLQIHPIIIEEIVDGSYHKKPRSHHKPKSHHKTKSKSKGRSKSHSSRKRSRSRSKSKSRGKGKSSSKPLTPDYLKTIY